MLKLLIKVCTILACLHFTLAFAGNAEPSVVPDAFLDQVAVDPAARTVQLAGWAVSAHGKVEDPKLHVLVDGQEIYAGHPQRQSRPDVAKATGHSDWIDAGWTVTVPLAATLPDGTRSLLVRVQFGNEAPIDSKTSTPQNALIDVPRSGSFVRGALGVLFAGLALLLVSYFFAPSLSRTVSRKTGLTIAPHAWPVAGMVICFAILVGLGVSGSSIHQTERDGLPIQGIETTLLANASRPIRADEWLVLSPMAIGQARHVPAFPVVNTNLGPDGQNMLVVGMTSVPVLGVSALGRPATWGYFFLPLPQAMAWHWWFPAFACVLGLWACFSVLFPGQWRTGFVLSLCFVTSPYVVAWSYWPAYVTLFAATAFAAVIALVKGDNHGLKPVLAVVLGISAAGFVLTLYPAWQVPLAYLFALLLAAVAARDWRSLRFSAGNLVWLVLGLALAGVIVASWWLDARDAIAAMVATIYPGQRTAELGGGIDPWYLARGFTNFTTLYSNLEPLSNQSEVSSFLYFLVPALVGAVFNRAHTGRNKPVFFAILTFLAIAFWYQYLGFPVGLAKLSQWGRTFATRVDIAVGVASIALLGLALAKDPGSKEREAHPLLIERIGAGIAALFWVALIWWSMRHAPEPVASLMDRPRRVLMLVFIGWCSYALAARWSKAFLVSLLALLVFSTAAFNPWMIISEPSDSKTAAGGCVMDEGRTLVLGSDLPPMTLMASGCKVLNGVSYYPQMSLWRALDPDRRQVDVYNRYQHLFVYLADLKGSPLPVLENTQTGRVHITVDPHGFDFARLPISYVLVRSDAAMTLSSNPSLQKMAEAASGWNRFKVVR